MRRLKSSLLQIVLLLLEGWQRGLLFTVLRQFSLLFTVLQENILLFTVLKTLENFYCLLF